MNSYESAFPNVGGTLWLAWRCDPDCRPIFLLATKSDLLAGYGLPKENAFDAAFCECCYGRPWYGPPRTPVATSLAVAAPGRGVAWPPEAWRLPNR